MGEENKPNQKVAFFRKLSLSLLISSGENNIAKLAGDMWITTV